MATGVSTNNIIVIIIYIYFIKHGITCSSFSSISVIISVFITAHDIFKLIDLARKTSAFYFD